jgi:predicted DNA-binding transcriptional regulator AlpA
MNQKQLLSKQDVQELAGISRATLDRLRSAGRFPRPVGGVDSRPRWRLADVQKWLSDRPFRRKGG